MTRKAMTQRARVVNPIHGLQAGTLCTVKEYNSKQPCIITVKKRDYYVHKDNLEILDL